MRGLLTHGEGQRQGALWLKGKAAEHSCLAHQADGLVDVAATEELWDQILDALQATLIGLVTNIGYL